MNFQKIESHVVFDGKIMKVINDRIRYENGHETGREVAIHSGAAAVVPVTQKGDLILVRQYRYAMDEVTLEIPAGLLEENEEPAVCAARELEEETGYKPGTMEFLFKFYSSPGFCTETVYVYKAENLKPSVQHLDEDEFIDLVEVPLQEALQMIRDGRIVDGKTIAAISYVALYA